MSIELMTGLDTGSSSAQEAKYLAGSITAASATIKSRQPNRKS